MTFSKESRFDIACELIESFCRRSSVFEAHGDPARRYLYTDALALRNLVCLYRKTKDERYKNGAERLIELVHKYLGHHRNDNSRNGWLSGLDEESGKLDPTAGGLRIGKEFPERKKNEPYDSAKEWERDGQYFHYLTRWMDALAFCARELSDDHYARWAARLCQRAASAFVVRSDGMLSMNWKMSIDLTWPQVETMGAHDPLEGYLCAKELEENWPANAQELEQALKDFGILCRGRNWSTTDSLGIGILLVDARKSRHLKHPVKDAEYRKLASDALASLEAYAHANALDLEDNSRLAFRECGLSMGLRALQDELFFQEFTYLADEIESFWIQSWKKSSVSWLRHQDINEVSLAASLCGSFA